ncbi:WYL domain-containing protein [Bauldia sp.]|uniref:WYL domain-containing protein n=1 Tax=Bauldia sp. TaxID=2575872 RepID=UPI003BAAC27D
MSADLLCRAIKDRCTLTFTYHGSAREAEPHIVGYDSDGDLTLSAWQSSGGSGEGWRDFHVSKLSGLAITQQTFSGPRPGYNRNDRTLSRIVCCL